MSIFKNYKAHSSASRLSEELLYEQVLAEIDSGVFREGLRAKALANAGGDSQKTRALYIQYRVQSIRDEAELTNYVAESEKTKK